MQACSTCVYYTYSMSALDNNYTKPYEGIMLM